MCTGNPRNNRHCSLGFALDTMRRRYNCLRSQGTACRWRTTLCKPNELNWECCRSDNIGRLFVRRYNKRWPDQSARRSPRPPLQRSGALTCLSALAVQSRAAHLAIIVADVARSSGAMLCALRMIVRRIVSARACSTFCSSTSANERECLE